MCLVQLGIMGSKKATVDSLRLEREAVAHKLEFIDNEAKHHAEAPLDTSTVDAYLKELDVWKTMLDDIHKQVVSLQPIDMDEQKRDYYLLLGSIRTIGQSLRGIKLSLSGSENSSKGNQGSSGSHLTNGVRLPKLELPSFCGSHLEWNTFKDSYEASIHSNAAISNVQKFTYLKSLLKKEPSRQIERLALTSTNYDIAWKELNERYDNPIKLEAAIWDNFFDHPRTDGTGNSLRALVDVINQTTRSFELMGLAINREMESVIVYQIQKKLDAENCKLWSQTIKDKKTPPLQDVREFLENRANALDLATKGSKPQKTASTHFIKGNKQQWADRKCSLGCNDKHPLFKCKKFNGMNITERREAVKTTKACFNCLTPGHGTISCKSKLKCRTCNRHHNTLLHDPSWSAGNKQKERDTSSSKEDEQTA